MRITLRTMTIAVALFFAFSTPWAAAQDKKIELRIGHAHAPLKDSMLHVASVTFKENVERLSGGRIQAKVFPSGQLGSDKEMVNLTMTGAQDLFSTSLNLITNYAQRLDALILPYMFPEPQNYRKAISGLWGYFNDYLTKKANMRLIAMYDSGYRHILSMTPIRTLEEVRKVKFRVPPSPIMIETHKAWGISPIQIPWGELFNAMQLRVVDAFECDDSVLISARYNEVVKYITNNDYMLQISVLVMSEATYKKLPPDLQKIVDQASRETQRDMLSKSEALVKHCLDVSVKKGVKVLGRPTDYETWVKLARATWPKFYPRVGDGDAKLGKEVVDRIFAASQR
jgi:tripartite ATP-independent transporter DctP family solute receptor